MGTHNERGFRARRIGRLERNATVAALAEPARSAGLPMSVGAVDMLAEESQDYPYFIQMLGSAAWEAAERLGARGITESAARAAVAEAREEIASFYGARFMEAERRGVEAALRPVASLLTAEDGSARYDEIKALLRRVAAEAPETAGPITLLETLNDLGVIWETADDRWEMGIPSFARYVLQRVAARPPVVPRRATAGAPRFRERLSGRPISLSTGPSLADPRYRPDLTPADSCYRPDLLPQIPVIDRTSPADSRYRPDLTRQTSVIDRSSPHKRSRCGR